MAARKAGQIVINVSAGTSALAIDLEKAGAKVKDFAQKAQGAGRQSGAGFVEAAAGVRLMSGNVNTNVRAVARFMSNVLGLGPILRAAFPVAGAVMFGVMVGDTIEKVVKLAKEIKNADRAINDAFRPSTMTLRMTNDELQLMNDKLENEIAKLEGRRENGLKLMLDEAKKSADALVKSLDTDLEALNRLMKEQDISIFRVMLGEANTAPVKKEAEEFSQRIFGINKRGENEIDRARATGDVTKIDAARLKLNQDLATEYDKELVTLRKMAEDVKKFGENAPGKGEIALGGAGRKRDVRAESAAIGNMITQLQQMRSYIDLQQKSETLTRTKNKLEIDHENKLADRPFADRMELLRAGTGDLLAKLNSIGQTEAFRITSESATEARKQIVELNKSLEKMNKPKLVAGGVEEQQIREELATQLRIKAQTAWDEQILKSGITLKQHISSLNDLTNAIGAGYEATREANVQTKLMSEYAEHLTDQEFMLAHAGEMNARAARLRTEHDAEHANQIAQTIDKISDQIDIETELAKVEVLGAAAVEQATFQMKLQKIAKDNNLATAGKLIAAEVQLYSATKAKSYAKELESINVEHEKAVGLLEATAYGEEAVRKAGLAAKYEAIRKEKGPGLATEEIVNRTAANDELEFQQKTLAEAVKTSGAYKEQIRQVDLKIAALQRAYNIDRSQYELLVQIRNLEIERLHLASEQALAGDKASGALRAFFLEMQARARSTMADINRTIYEGMVSALDRSSDEFAKFLTGQKTSFGRMFQDIGEKMVSSAIKSAASKGLAKLGEKLGIKGPEKPDGSTAAKALWVRWEGMGLASHGTSSLGDPLGGSSNESQGTSSLATLGKSVAPTIGGLLKGLFSKILGGLIGKSGEAVSSSVTYMADGGPTSPDQAYIVGESGPEVLSGISGRITRNSEARRMLGEGGGTVYYSIDARGTDPVLTDQRVRTSIIAAHNSAVHTSVKVGADRVHRVPRTRSGSTAGARPGI